MVKPMWSTLSNVGNAARNGNTSFSTLLILEISFPISVRFAKMHSIVCDSLFRPCASAKGIKVFVSRKQFDSGLQD